MEKTSEREMCVILRKTEGMLGEGHDEDRCVGKGEIKMLTFKRIVESDGNLEKYKEEYSRFAHFKSQKWQYSECILIFIKIFLTF